ncbi:MAG TPA: cyclase family protein [Bacteroidota bacterium]
MRTPFAVSLLSLLFTSCAPKQPLAGTIIDLTYALDSTSIFWPTEKGFVFEKGFEGYTPGGYYYTANRFWSPEHGGTHIDAPIHFAEGRNTVDQIPVDQLIGSGIVIDVSEKCAADRDYLISVEDVQNWEAKNGKIPDGSIVLLRSGLGKFWHDRAQYMGTAERGDSAVKKLHFPGLHPDAAKWIVENRKIKAIGLDTPSIDYGQSTLFESHVALYKRNIPAFENVANLDKLPEKNFTVIALPMKIRGGSGGPLRIIAIVGQR